MQMWNVGGKRHHGRARSNNSVEAFRAALSPGFLKATRPPTYKVIEPSNARQSVTNLGMAQLATGDVMGETKKQAARNARIEPLVLNFDENNDAMRFLRGIGYNYM